MLFIDAEAAATSSSGVGLGVAAFGEIVAAAARFDMLVDVTLLLATLLTLLVPPRVTFESFAARSFPWSRSTSPFLGGAEVTVSEALRRVEDVAALVNAPFLRGAAGAGMGAQQEENAVNRRRLLFDNGQLNIGHSY